MNRYSLFDPRWRSGCYGLRAMAYYYKTWQGYTMGDLHRHDQAEIMYVLKGNCRVEFEGETAALGRGEFVLIDAGVRHRLVMDPEASCRMLNIEFKFEARHDRILPFSAMASDPDLGAMLTAPFAYTRLRDREEVFPILRQLIMEHDADTTGNELLCQTLFFQLLVMTARLWREMTLSDPAPALRYVREAVAYIRHHYDQDLRVRDIAGRVKVNENYLQKVFKANEGVTIVEYLTRVRMDRAQMLLRNTAIPVQEICDYVGVNSRQYFSKLFRDRFGVSPARYRKSVQPEMIWPGRKNSGC